MKTAFCTDPAVRQRLTEFLGDEQLEGATAAYLTHADGCAYDPARLHPTSHLDWFARRNLDIARSLADTHSILLHLDVEHVNFDSPADVFLDPWRAFDLQEPVVRTIERLLLGWGIAPLHIITGQGHHFVWQIPRSSALGRTFVALAPDVDAIDSWNDRMPDSLRDRIDSDAQRAFATTGMLMEYVAHRIKFESSALAAIPVQITAVHVGAGQTHRREIINIDISEYGDPLHTRMIRMPFTNYRKPWLNGLARQLKADDAIPAFRTIPLYEMDVRQALKCRQVDADVQDLARRACVRIPVQEDGTQHLLDEYLSSPLRAFHEHFYTAHHDDRSHWHDGYERTPLATLPPCVQHVLTFPNDLLLKPAGIQLITRTLTALGWHPRHIGGFIRSKFEDPSHHWGIDWRDYDPATRADFYVRLFAGQHAAGLDEAIDFNCTSNREKGFCFPHESSGCSLESLRHQLLSTAP